MSILPLVLALIAVFAAAVVVWRERQRGARLNAELHELRAGLLASTRLASLGNLVAGLVHEINTPMGALSSNHDVIKRALLRLQAILADEQVDASELDEVRRIVRALDEVIGVNTLATDRVNQLVRDLRDFGRPDHSEIAWADLHDGLDSTLAIMRHELRAIEVVKEYGDLPRVLCRPQKLNEVFMNLLVNACQASASHGRITIRTAHGTGNVSITIADEGCGIAPAHHARIFEPGFTTKGSRVGMGMGLLIARQIVEQHEGRIELISALDRGSEFTVTLPVAPSALKQQATQFKE